jgi:hypothetical protein
MTQKPMRRMSDIRGSKSTKTSYTDESALDYLRKLHPVVLHRLTSKLLSAYGYDDDASLCFCSECYLKTTSFRGNCMYNFTYCYRRGCNEMICEKCLRKVYPNEYENDSDNLYDTYLCAFHKNATLFQLLYKKLQ